MPSEPVPISEVSSLIAAGKISDDTSIWYEGMDKWEPLSVMKEKVLAAIGM